MSCRIVSEREEFIRAFVKARRGNRTFASKVYDALAPHPLPSEIWKILERKPDALASSRRGR